MDKLPDWYQAADDAGKLTEEQVKEGWHFCADFDYLLIHRDHEEMDYCHCFDEEN